MAKDKHPDFLSPDGTIHRWLVRFGEVMGQARATLCQFGPEGMRLPAGP